MAMTHVFISYVHENRDIVDQLRNELENRGVKVWLDRDAIGPGERWKDAIKRAIRGGSFFIACFSKEFNGRDRSHMHEELTLAIDELRARPSEKTWFIPVLLNETHIPTKTISSAEDLSDLQVTRLYDNWTEGIGRILRVVR
jgi:TIR domain